MALAVVALALAAVAALSNQDRAPNNAEGPGRNADIEGRGGERWGQRGPGPPLGKEGGRRKEKRSIDRLGPGGGGAPFLPPPLV